MFKKLGLGCVGLIGALVVLGIIGAALGGGSRGNQATLVATAAPAPVVPQSGDAAPAAAAPTDAPAESTEAPAPEATATPSGPQLYQLGETIQLGDMALAILGWHRAEGTQFAKPEAGNTFVGVDLLVVNQGSSATNLSTLAQMTLKDSTERRYTVDLLATTALGVAAPEGELAPGERVRGSVGFQVPADATGLTFVFDGGLFSNGKVFVSLGDEPAVVEAPAPLAGEQVPQAAAVGEPVTIGDLTVTVNGVSSPEGTQFAKPDDGKRFLVVDLSVTNGGSQAANVSTLVQMKLKDATGQQYNLDLMATTVAGGAAPEGELAPGETVRGPVGFQVPNDATDLLFVFDGSVFGAGKTFVQLPK